MKQFSIKVLALFLIAIGVHSNTCGQVDEKPVIGITDFIYDADLSDEEGATNKQDILVIQEYAANAFVNSGRFTLVERGLLSKINRELEDNKEEAFIMSDYLPEQGKLLGAKYLLLGRVSKVSVQKKKNVAGDLLFKKANVDKDAAGAVTKDKVVAYVDFTLRIVNVETGVIGEGKAFSIKPSAGDFGAPDRHMALQNLQGRIETEVEEFIDEFIPKRFKFLEVVEESGGKLASFYMKGGKVDKVEKGTSITIFKVEYKDFGDGPQRLESQIGSAKVHEVNGARVSLCEIISGGDDIMSELANGGTIICEEN